MHTLKLKTVDNACDKTGAAALVAGICGPSRYLPRRGPQEPGGQARMGKDET